MKYLIILALLFVSNCSDKNGYNFSGYIPNLDIDKQNSADTLKATISSLSTDNDIGKIIKYFYTDGDTTRDSIQAKITYFDRWGRLDSIADKENGSGIKYVYNTKNYITQIRNYQNHSIKFFFFYDEDNNLIKTTETRQFDNIDSIVTINKYNFMRLSENSKTTYSGGTSNIEFHNWYDESGNILYTEHGNVKDTISYEFKNDWFYKYLVKSGNKELISKYNLNNNNDIISFERYDDFGELLSKVNFSYSGDQINIDSTRYDGGIPSRTYSLQKKTDGRILDYIQKNNNVLFIHKVYKYNSSNLLTEYAEYTKNNTLHFKREITYDEFNMPQIEKIYNENNEITKLYKYAYKKFD